MKIKVLKGVIIDGKAFYTNEEKDIELTDEVKAFIKNGFLEIKEENIEESAPKKRGKTK